MRGPRFDPRPGQELFSILSPVTYKMEEEYVVMLGIIHTCTALRYKLAFIATG